MNQINIGKVCRTCVTENENMISIDSLINCNGTPIPIIQILNSVLSHKVIESDQYPNLICSGCKELAISAYTFKLQCDHSQIILEKYVKYAIVKEENDVNESVDNLNNNNNVTSNISITPVKEESKNGVQHNVHRNCTISNAERKLLVPISNILVVKNEVEENKPQINKVLDNIYFCSQCNKPFTNKYIFNAHMRRHEFKGQFLCNVCGKGFNSQSCLTRHNHVHTGEKNYECHECHKRFPSSNNLNLHSRIHSGHKPYLCTVCGKCFSHPTGLTYHMRTHTQEKRYSCDLCGKRFTIQCHLDSHKKTHSGERPFACKQCGKAFIKKIDMKRHEEIHSGLKPHTCTICKKSFLRLKNLNYHMMLHTEERPHTCPECGKGFIRSYYLKDHVRKHHKKLI